MTGSAGSGPRLTRRQVLHHLAYGAAGLAAGGQLVGCSTEAGSGTRPARTAGARSTSAAAPSRVLVVVELVGGNDGWSTLAPLDGGRWRDLRPTLALPHEEIIDWGVGYGLNVRLHGLHERGVAALTGVGAASPDLSHTEMLNRWWSGRPTGTDMLGDEGITSGFLGRLCDALQGDEPITGVSLDFGEPLPLRSRRATTAGLGDGGSATLDGDPSIDRLMRDAIRQMAQTPDPSLLGRARRGALGMLSIVDLLTELPPPSSGFPAHRFGTQMAAASRLLRAGAGIRVVHVPFQGSQFDTHLNHAETHARLMTQLNDGVSAFLQDVDTAGLTDHVLVATTSEFGRRPQEHGNGLDHGNASTALLLGPVVHGMHGEPSPLARLDQDDNLIATLTFDRYLATLAEWMEVDPAEVLPSNGAAPRSVRGLLRT